MASGRGVSISYGDVELIAANHAVLSPQNLDTSHRLSQHFRLPAEHSAPIKTSLLPRGSVLEAAFPSHRRADTCSSARLDAGPSGLGYHRLRQRIEYWRAGRHFILWS